MSRATDCTEHVSSESISEVLKYCSDSGISCTLRDELHEEDYHTQIAPKSSARADAARQHKVQYALDWVAQAHELASACTSLEELRRVVSYFEGCEIKNTATNTVFSDGNPAAKLMFIGEAPGNNEDKKGIPFCGASGLLLDKMLAAIGLDRTKIYISNTVFWRPPGNRRPTDFELEVCRPFVEKHISLINPLVLVMVGGTACYSLLKTQDSISRIRGKFYEYSNSFLSNSITSMAIFHPAYLLRQPMQKRLAWEDLKMLKRHLDTLENLC
ncbi:uracil-DNA glycosylase family protein [Candidatus Anaplasma sp. TIGMIC]|uniref:uracil-DNA glycosylase n=1 Tax=Candidatus Anaplasma sp. TIGMIC TaxID=3020713 RepID=UPI00233145A7|nr:uracil-DNA glycosylase [Candidatus Anaplasma sp. TIGMIC]MDB1135683.1 uracil-DNA glycosylase [Candidatus Anaplasma sp. TIGMIC]